MSVPRPLPPDFAASRIEADEPEWLRPVVGELESLLRLPTNWDSYGARPIDPRAAGATLSLLTATMQPNTPIPSIVPMSRGDIQVEWHLRGMDIEVVVPAEGPIRIWQEDLRNGTEHEFTLDQDQEPLRAILRELTARP
jgi:hypothetical protein